MNSGLYTAVSGLRAQMEALDVLANNLANLNTAGFKEEKTFYRILNETLAANETDNPAININNQAVLAGRALNFIDGSLLATHRDLDVALTGNGFLTVATPHGTRFTRNGGLMLNSKSVLCTAEGYPVLGENGQIALGEGRIDINAHGEVSLNGLRVDRLKIASFDPRIQMLKEGSSLLLPGGDPVKADPTNVEVHQGYLEQSNVNPIASVVGLVDIMRQYESIQKCVNLLMNDINAKSIEKIGRY